MTDLSELIVNPAFVSLCQHLGVWAVGDSGDKTVEPRISLGKTDGKSVVFVEMKGPAMTVELMMRKAQ